MNSVLVTGAARGIGKALCLRLAQQNWQVYAGVRKLSDGEALAAEDSRIVPVLLDVTNPDHIAALDGVLPTDLTAVVNNAGIVADGPVELLDLDTLRNQFEVNVFGALAVTQAVLPRLRATRGRIVFISSLSGRISTPGTGAYNSSKFALEGLVDALRVELRPWHIRTSLIEPGPIATDLWFGATDMIDNTTARLTAPSAPSTPTTWRASARCPSRSPNSPPPSTPSSPRSKKPSPQRVPEPATSPASPARSRPSRSSSPRPRSSTSSSRRSRASNSPETR